MAKLTKKQKEALSKYDPSQVYSLEAASTIVKDITMTKFDASVDLDIRLGVDPDKVAEATEAGADYAGLDDYIAKIESGWTDIDVIITMPNVMAKVGRLGRVLGPRGLMPNPKSGTVTLDVAKAVREVKAGKIDFKVDKFGIIHAGIGKASFTAAQIEENVKELILTISKLKPSSSKGTYFKSIHLSSTMSPGIAVDKGSIQGI